MLSKQIENKKPRSRKLYELYSVRKEPGILMDNNSLKEQSISMISHLINSWNCCSTEYE